MANGWALGKFGGEFAQVTQTYVEQLIGGDPHAARAIFRNQTFQTFLFLSCIVGATLDGKAQGSQVVSVGSFSHLLAIGGHDDHFQSVVPHGAA
jgi:hypothetical protein